MLFPVALSVRRQTKPGEQLSPGLVEQVLSRDNYACRFCGLENDRNVVIIGGQTRQEQAATADLLCASCHDLAGVSRGALLFLPGVDRADFNHLVRTIYLAMVVGDPEEQDEAEEILVQLLTLAKPVEVCWGTSRASDFGRMLTEAPDTVYNKRQQVLEGLHLLLHPACLPRETVGSWVRGLRKKGFDSLKKWKIVFEAHFSGKGTDDDDN